MKSHCFLVIIYSRGIPAEFLLSVQGGGLEEALGSNTSPGFILGLCSKAAIETVIALYLGRSSVGWQVGMRTENASKDGWMGMDDDGSRERIHGLTNEKT